MIPWTEGDVRAYRKYKTGFDDPHAAAAEEMLRSIEWLQYELARLQLEVADRRVAVAIEAIKATNFQGVGSADEGCRAAALKVLTAFLAGPESRA